MIISPFLACTGRPSTVMVTVSAGSGICRSLLQAVGRERAMAEADMVQELVPEHADPRGHRTGDGRAQDAYGGLGRRPAHPGHDVVADVHQKVEVGFAALAVLNTLHDLFDPTRPLPAWRALPARLAVEKPGDPPYRPHHAGRFVHHRDG